MSFHHLWAPQKVGARSQWYVWSNIDPELTRACYALKQKDKLLIPPKF